MKFARINLFLVLLAGMIGASNAASSTVIHGKNGLRRLPLFFEANHGQLDESVKFLARTPEYQLLLTEKEALFALPELKPRHAKSNAPASRAVLRMRSGDIAPSEIQGLEPQSARINYLTGNNPQEWHTDVTTYSRVVYKHVYPGIDQVFYWNGNRLEFDFEVEPEADPSKIRLSFDGADRITIDAGGNLQIALAGHHLILAPPHLYQVIDGERRAIAGQYQLDGSGEVGFQLGRYNKEERLIIDPVLKYSTFLGGTRGDWGSRTARDPAGNIYVTGTTVSVDLAVTAGVFSSSFKSRDDGTTDVFVAKFTPAGSLVYLTYLGGVGNDHPGGIAVDPQGNAYITGSTTRVLVGSGFVNDFPATPGAFQKTQQTRGSTAGSNAFLSILNSSGTGLIYSTFLGGSQNGPGAVLLAASDGWNIAIGPSGRAYLAGSTTETDFPTTENAFQKLAAGQPGNPNLFLTILDPSKSGAEGLVYSTYLGGTENFSNYPAGVAVDSAGIAYVSGSTMAKDFPTTAGAFQETLKGDVEGVVVKLDPARPGRQALLYASYLGGSNTDSTNGIALGPPGIVYVTGETTSPDFPTTAEAFQKAPPSATSQEKEFFDSQSDAFLVAIDTTREGPQSLVYSTYFGGEAVDRGNSVYADAAGNAYIAGDTQSIGLPVTDGAFQSGNRTSALFATLDGGKTWQPAVVGAHPFDVEAIAVAPNDSSLLYAGGREGFFKSSDGGKTWTRFSKGLQKQAVYALVIDPLQPQILYAGTLSGGVFKSFDGGASWSASGLPNAFVPVMAIDPKTSSRIYAGTNEGLFRSTDGGVNWSLLTGSVPLRDGVRTFAVDPVSPATLYVAGNCELFKSTDGGGNWVRSESGLPTSPVCNFAISTMAVDPAQPTTLYIANQLPFGFGTLQAAGRIYKSTTAGQNWALSNQGLSPASIASILVDPSLPSRIYAATENGIYRSMDRGNSWEALNTGLTNLSMRALAIDPKNPSRLLAGGGFLSSDAFVAKFSPKGHLVYSTYLGGGSGETGSAILADASNDAYISGSTGSVDFPIRSAFQPGYRGTLDALEGEDLFLTRLSLDVQSFFSQFGVGGGIASTLILVDPSARLRAGGEARVFDGNGKPLPVTIAGEARAGAFSFEIPPLGVEFFETDPQGDLKVGWVQTESEIAVGGTILFAGSFGVAGVGAARPAARLLVPVESDAAGNSRTGVALSNPEETSTRLTLVLRQTNGQPVPQGTLEIVLPGLGQLARFVDELYAGRGIDFSRLDAVLEVTASAPVAALAIRTSPGAFATLPVVAVGEGERRFFLAEFGDGQGLTSTLILVNSSPDQTASGTAKLFSSDGTPLRVTINQVLREGQFSFNIPPLGIALFRTTGSGDLKVGSVHVESNVKIGGAVLFAGTFGVAGVGGAQPVTRFLVPIESNQEKGVQTGVAISNPKGTQVTARLTLRKKTGEAVAQGAADLVIPGNGQIARYPEELYAGRGIDFNRFQGTLEVSSADGVNGMAIRVSPGEFATFPVTPVRQIE